MLILLNVITAFAYILDGVVTFFLIIVFARVVLSWIRIPYSPIVHFIYQATEPVLKPIRRRLPLTWGIDLSPMVIFLILIVVRLVVVASILDYVAIARMNYLQGVAK
jgi:YggT family protein